MKTLLVVLALVSGTAWSAPSVPVTAPASYGPRVPRIKLFRSNPHRLSAIRLQGTNPYDAPDDDYICSAMTRRLRAVQPTIEVEDDELSDYVQVRLAVARARAMARYQEIWS